ncbi:hypothetical protein [Leuconostoc fallax]|uniref:hypothetical protein n=1 Tax=Leuconostoc fallax TaxID=1251 RepID=UPI001C1EB4FE|nr:hypothetical protein [Leuconostoc fallax]MBU7455669.1 hypothetical protein [Leuconostoc fallax]
MENEQTELRTVYGLEDGIIISSLVDDDYQLKPNETFEKPVDGIYQPFSFSNGLIIGATQSEWEESINEQHSNQPKTSEELVADLTQQFATAQMMQSKTNANLLQQNAELVKQVADLQAQKETTNG